MILRATHWLLPFALGAAAPYSAAPALAAPPDDAAVAFAATSTLIPAGARRAIAVQLTTAPDTDTTLDIESSDPSIVVVTRQARALAGSTLAFVRIHALAPGSATLRTGHASIRIDVTPATRLPAPSVTGPAPGAVVWGEFAASVELPDLDNPARGFSGSLVLRLSDGRELKPTTESSQDRGPVRQAVFMVDASRVLSTRLELEPVWTLPDGDEHAGAPIELRVIRPAENDVLAGEAEATFPGERPKRFARAPRRGSIGSDRDASGGKYLINAGAEPALCFPLKVETPGLYQVFLTARGTYAGGAFPTIGLVVDGAQYALTNARVPDTTWRRFALGLPFPLQPGEHLLTPHFENDFYAANLADRNLDIDRIEVLRLPDDARHAGPPVPPAPPGSMMSAAMPAASGDTMTTPATPGAMNGAMSMTGTPRPDAAGLTYTPDPWGLARQPVRVALTRPLDGRPAAGELVVDGVCWWEGEDNPAPLVTLHLNGKPYAQQITAAPRFVIDPTDLAPGTNTILLSAVCAAGEDRTPLQRIDWTPPTSATLETGEAPHKSHRFLRYTVHSPGWDDAAMRSISRDRSPPERRSFGFASNAEGVLTLPDDLAGRFEVSIESNGQEFGGPPILAATLLTGDTRTPIGESATNGWWTPRRTGTVELSPGPKKLAIAFTNDRYEENKGDRNVWFQAVVLRELSDEDAGPPIATILYPRAGATIGLADAVVATAADDRAVTRAELLIDGQPARVDTDLSGAPGRFLLPLITRTLAPGEHTLSVRATDAKGNKGESAPVRVIVSHDPPSTPSDYDRAVHLLNRLGFGPSPVELADALVEGDDAWLQRVLTQDADDPAELAALGMGIVRFPNARGEYDTSRRPIAHALLSRNSVRARFVLWVENHFSTWARKTEGDRKWNEHAAFARLGAAPFFDLLLASATSPAMLRYLDQEQSYSGRLNENYAREIMELHTLGVHAGYSQDDVTSLAGLLTGWTTAREGDGSSGGEMRSWSFAFDPALSSGAPQRVVGVDFPPAAPGERYDRVREALEVLAAHPSTAHFVCRKLAEHYVSVPATESLVSDLARRFTETGGDMAKVMLALAHHPEFTRPDAPPRLAHPMEFALRIARTSSNANPWMIADYMQRSGNGLFDRSTPDGYPEQDSAYVDSNALLQRWRFAQDSMWSLAGLVPDAIRYGNVPTDATQAAQWMQQVVDCISVRLTGHVLSPESNTAALDLLRAAPGNRQDRITQLAPFIAQLPEASLR